ncbi:MAG TPA: ABC transporter substrate-binding protein [Thermomicrobiales bacterium]|nr:ABC transporter substrate-binding protein [Thermomicrobiales bacterium]
MSETERRSRLQQLMSVTGSRRQFLTAAAAAGLIPVLTTETLTARAAAAQATPAPTPVKGGEFITLGHQTVDTLSPDNEGATVVWACVVQMFYALYIVNENYEIVPILAESHEVSTDGKTYTFKLKSGVKFHNGDDFSSADVKYTYDWIHDPKNASLRAGAFELVASVEAPDPTTVVVNLTQADVTFMVNVAPTLIYPATYHAKIGEEAFTAKPVGTGPFKLKEWIPAQSTTLEAYDDYFRGRPNFDTFRLDVVPEAAGRTAALESGQADSSVWSLSAEDNNSLEDSGNYTVYKNPSLAVNHFPLNNAHPVLKDKAVRQALIYATDRQALADNVYLGQAAIATSNLSPSNPKYYNADVPKYPLDVDKAKSLLDAAGWVPGDGGIRSKDGVKASFTLQIIQGDTQRRPEAELAQQWWKEIGIDCQLAETNNALAGLVAGQYDAGLFNWTYGGVDPDARDTLTTKGANNFNHFSNAEVDDLLTKGVSELDEAKRITMYKRVQEIVAEEVPFIFLLYVQWITFWNTDIKGLPPQEKVQDSSGIYNEIYKLWKES